VLEKYFRHKLIDSKRFSDIGRYWDRKGENEIDIVAVNDYERIINFYEVKRNPDKINLNILQQKAQKILSMAEYKDYQPEFIGLSLDDM